MSVALSGVSHKSQSTPTAWGRGDPKTHGGEQTVLMPDCSSAYGTPLTEVRGDLSTSWDGACGGNRSLDHGLAHQKLRSPCNP